MDITKAIEPKSDQQNADSLLTGPKTIKIMDIKYDPRADQQPLWIYFDGDEGKPWKPCKTAARCLVSIWGPDANKWIGLQCTIYCDPEVSFGGVKTGGIRVSHMEGLTSPRTLQLTRTRGKKGATVIKPLEVKPVSEHVATEPQPEVNRDQLRTDMEKYANDPDGKRGWWAGLSAAERAAVKELASEAQ